MLKQQPPCDMAEQHRSRTHIPTDGSVRFSSFTEGVVIPEHDITLL